MIGFNLLGKKGRLGNQMFQYALIYSLSKDMGTEFTIPDNTKLSEVLQIKPDKIGIVDGKQLYERHFHFDSSIFELDKNYNYDLCGYFQSEKYFKKYEEEIRKQFDFVPSIKKLCLGLKDAMQDSIALHIRRGDYLDCPSYHVNLTLDYYEKALSYFEKDRKVMVFSDDVKWCKEQEIFKEQRFFICHPSSGPNHLYLMSNCCDFIIANSSFSWWGAYLANRGKVIAPKQWFGPDLAQHDTKDICPESWIRI